MEWKKVDSALTLEDVVKRNLGIGDIHTIDSWMNKEYIIENIDEVVSRIRRAVKNHIPIKIMGDYDTDGVTSSTILRLGIEKIGGHVTVRLPRRFSEGYGLSMKVIDETESGLLITVDNGIAAISQIKAAKEKGLEVIVIDHHLRNDKNEIPDADVIIDPNALDNSADFNGYCGAGLAYKIVEKLCPELKETVLGLAAIGTVADVMKLREENYVIVKKGLQNLVQFNGRTCGTYALLAACGMDRFLDEKNIGFKISPIINAAGRMEDNGPLKVHRLLSMTGNLKACNEMTEELIDLNEQRKDMKITGTEAVLRNIEENHLRDDYPMIIYESGISEGIIGLVAGNISEEFHVPCLMFSDSNKEGVLKGSGRTYGDFNLKKMLDSHPEDFIGYGGHAEAAGMSIKKDMLNKLRDDMKKAAAPFRPTEVPDYVLYDLEIDINDVVDTFIESRKYAPYGNGNPAPRYLIRSIQLEPMNGAFFATMGKYQQHIKFYSRGITLVAFDMAERWAADGEPKTLDIICELGVNHIQGKTYYQAEIIDYRPIQPKKVVTSFAAALAAQASRR